VEHDLLIRGAIKDFGCKTKLTVKQVSQPLNLSHKLVLCRTVKLCDPFSTVGIGDTVLRPLKLNLDVLSTLLGLLASGLRLDHVRKLVDEIELTRTGLLIHSIKQREITHRSTQSRIRLIHHRIQRVLNDSDRRLIKSHLLSNTLAIVVNLDPDLSWPPGDNLADTHAENVESASLLRIESRINRNQRYGTFLKHSQNSVYDQSSMDLINIGF